MPGFVATLDAETLRALCAHRSVRQHGRSLHQAAMEALERGAQNWTARKTYEAAGPSRGSLCLSLGNSDSAMRTRTPVRRAGGKKGAWRHGGCLASQL